MRLLPMGVDDLDVQPHEVILPDAILEVVLSCTLNPKP